jgi:hypothetical protein
MYGDCIRHLSVHKPAQANNPEQQQNDISEKQWHASVLVATGPYIDTGTLSEKQACQARSEKQHAGSFAAPGWAPEHDHNVTIGIWTSGLYGKLSLAMRCAKKPHAALPAPYPTRPSFPAHT